MGFCASELDDEKSLEVPSSPWASPHRCLTKRRVLRCCRLHGPLHHTQGCAIYRTPSHQGVRFTAPRRRRHTHDEDCINNGIEMLSSAWLSARRSWAKCLEVLTGCEPLFKAKLGNNVDTGAFMTFCASELGKKSSQMPWSRLTSCGPSSSGAASRTKSRRHAQRE